MTRNSSGPLARRLSTPRAVTPAEPEAKARRRASDDASPRDQSPSVRASTKASRAAAFAQTSKHLAPRVLASKRLKGNQLKKPQKAKPLTAEAATRLALRYGYSCTIELGGWGNEGISVFVERHRLMTNPTHAELLAVLDPKATGV